ncbi:MAG TPA: lysophospholipid acyltransferase family protein [Oscillatoriaceae cyanobacterium]
MSLPATRSLFMHDLATYGVPGLMRIAIRGLEPVPREGPVLLLANRTSLLDPWLLSLAAGRAVQFAASSPLFWLPGLGQAAHRMNVVPLRPDQAANGGASAFAQALERGLPVAVFTDLAIERRPEGPRYTVSPGFLDVLLATRSEHIPVVPMLGEGRGRKLALTANPLLSSMWHASAQVLASEYPPLLYSENTLRVGRPIYWRDGGQSGTLQDFRRAVEDSLGALI